MASQRKGSVKESEKCKACDKSVGDKELGVQCELCDKWFHAGCVKIPEDVYKVLGKIANLHWFCEVCNSNACKLFVTLTKLNERVGQLESDVKNNQAEVSNRLGKVEKETDVFNKRVNDMDSRIAKIEQDFHKFGSEVTDDVNKMEENFQKLGSEISSWKEDFEDESWAKVVEKQVDAKFGQASIEMQTMQEKLVEAREAVTEEQDKEARRNNVILYRVPESGARTAEERSNDDKRYCEQFVSALEVGLAGEDIKRIFRLGRRNTSDTPATSASSAARPMLVEFSSRWAKNALMENLFKLKSLDAKFKDTVVAHDMTKKERLECKALVEEAKTKTEQESGDFVYIVRGLPGRMKIIMVRKRS